MCLYQLHLSMFTQLSTVFNDIFSIPEGPPGASQKEVQGRQGTVANPIILEHITSLEFNDFLFWVYRM